MVKKATGLSSVERALRVLEELSESPAGATELAHRLGTSKATAFRLARTLQANGYVAQLPDTRYRLGPACLILAARALGDIDLRGELRWAEEELHESTGETALLTVLAGRDVVCIDSIPSKHSIISVASVGQIWPGHASSAGLAFLADDPRSLEKYLQGSLLGYTDTTPTNPEELQKVLSHVRSVGYAVNISYFRDDVCAVGAVIHDATGRAAAALSVMLPKFRLEETGIEALGALVVDITNRASRQLGYHQVSG